MGNDVIKKCGDLRSPVLMGKASIHPINVSININRYLNTLQ